MTRLHFSIDIDAPRDRVWSVLWDDQTYRDWTSAFAAGSHAVSDWNQGSRVQFLDPNGNGMVAIIEQKVQNERMTFRHLAEIKAGQEQPPAVWAGARETYTLEDTGRGTTLTVDLDTTDEYRKMFEEVFPKALERVKALATGQRQAAAAGSATR